MLLEIRIRNLAIAEDLGVPLGPGLNVLSGSTGAGKSLVVQAVRWLRGEKTDPGLIRAGEENAMAEALFDLSARPDLLELLDDLGLDPSEDGLLRIRREQRREGRSRAFLDGRRTSAATLSRVCEGLLQLQSQHQQTSLLDPTRHRALLDACGLDPRLREEWRASWQDWRESRRALEAWERSRDEIREKHEILEYQRAELAAAGLQPGEMAALRERVTRLEGGARLIEAASAARERLDGDEAGVLAGLAEAAGRLDARAEGLHELEEARELLLQAQDSTQEAARILERFTDAVEMDPSRLEEDQARLSRLEELCRKYRRTEAELLAHLRQLEIQLDSQEWGEDPPARLQEPLRRSLAECEARGARLLRERRKLARSVARSAEQLLGELGMPEAELYFEVEPLRVPGGSMKIAGQRVEPRADGPESVQLLVRTNRGEALGPVERIASGGELSRIGLVLRTLAVQERRPALLVMDEVDAGVGADLGPAIAARLRGLADRLQLLVVTHLPAIAAQADRHLLAEKGAKGDRTVSRILVLEGETRLDELTRMIGGARSSARDLAGQLLREEYREGAS